MVYSHLSNISVFQMPILPASPQFPCCFISSASSHGPCKMDLSCLPVICCPISLLLAMKRPNSSTNIISNLMSPMYKICLFCIHCHLGNKQWHLPSESDPSIFGRENYDILMSWWPQICPINRRCVNDWPNWHNSPQCNCMTNDHWTLGEEGEGEGAILQITPETNGICGYGGGALAYLFSWIESKEK